MIVAAWLWGVPRGRAIGAVSMEPGRDYTPFQCDRACAISGIELSYVPTDLM